MSRIFNSKAMIFFLLIIGIIYFFLSFPSAFYRKDGKRYFDMGIISLLIGLSLVPLVIHLLFKKISNRKRFKE